MLFALDGKAPPEPESGTARTFAKPCDSMTRANSEGGGK